MALADGISSSRVSAIASSVAVRNFLDDYYCTPDTWSVKQSAGRVVAGVNAWLHAETRRGEGAEDRDRGYVCTFDAVILKGRSAHLFHVGDGRIARVTSSTLERLTEDHRVSVSSAQSYLARALGAGPHVEIDYRQVTTRPGDVFVLTTDGVHDYVTPEAIVAAIGPDLDRAAAEIAARAYAAGSPDNLTVQLVRLDSLPADLDHLLDETAELPPAPLLHPGETLDGHRVVRTLHDSARSHLYLATAPGGDAVVLKIPSIELSGDPAYLRRFMMEEWIARRVDSPYIVKHLPPETPRSRLYLVLEYVEGETLAQWMRDHARPSLESVRDIIGQVARGLDALHRREMTHGDLRPENVMIDRTGRVRLLDFGSSIVPGVAELEPEPAESGPLGTAQYSAPELLLGGTPDPASDICSLGLIAYHMLTGRLPYGAAPARARTPAALRRLRYRPATEGRPTVPAWVDGALRKAVHPSPARRYEAAADFVQDLRVPNPTLVARTVPLAERDPVVFWKAIALALAVAVAVLLVTR